MWYLTQQDYQRAVDEYDQRVFINFRLMLKELRSIYVSDLSHVFDVFA